MKKVLFVCTGNTCRSSMAEALFKKMLRQIEKHEEVEVSSCGISAIEGDLAALYAQKVMKQEGIDISSHRAKKLSADLLKSDLILTMTKSHKDYILNKYPNTKGKVFVLGEFTEEQGDEDVDTHDPYGHDEDTYRKVAEEIKQKLHRVIKRLNLM